MTNKQKKIELKAENTHLDILYKMRKDLEIQTLMVDDKIAKHEENKCRLENELSI